MSTRRAAFLGWWLVLAALGCGGTALLQQRVEAKAKGFDLVVTDVTDGPNSYERGLERIKPGSGLRFLWFKVRLRNELPTEQVFNYDRCDIDFGAKNILPNLVDMDKLVNLLVESKEDKLSGGEEISRKIIFTFPEGKFPTRLKCGDLTLALPLRTN
jgi:hypothetical protein